MPASATRLRRSEIDMRIEIMPLIDVIFLLLTFFIYAMVLMIRAEVLPMKVPALASGQPARPAPAVTLSLDRHGDLYLDREIVALDDVRDRLESVKAADPATVVYVAVEDLPGDQDRAPLLIALYDRLANCGLELKLLGRPAEQ